MRLESKSVYKNGRGYLWKVYKGKDLPEKFKFLRGWPNAFVGEPLENVGTPKTVWCSWDSDGKDVYGSYNDDLVGYVNVRACLLKFRRSSEA